MHEGVRDLDGMRSISESENENGLPNKRFCTTCPPGVSLKNVEIRFKLPGFDSDDRRDRADCLDDWQPDELESESGPYLES